MTNYVFDSSALVKRYVNEMGTKWIQSITTKSSANRIFVAHITSIEIVSAIMRRKRDGTLSSRSAKAARLLVDRHIIREYQVIRLTDEINLLAEDLLETYSLRAADAIQLASALEVNKRLVAAGLNGLIFVCADQRLLAAAQAEGIVTDDPNLHP